MAREIGSVALPMSVTISLYDDEWGVPALAPYATASFIVTLNQTAYRTQYLHVNLTRHSGFSSHARGCD